MQEAWRAQRVLIAMAILHRPRLLIADEPTSALDTINQAEALKLFARLSWERDMAMLYISHDLLSVASLCNQVAILKSGRVVESGDPESVFRQPRHPYTRQLVDAIPRLESVLGEPVTVASEPEYPRKHSGGQPFDAARTRETRGSRPALNAPPEK